MSKECWREKGCPFNSNKSFKYMKCWGKDYSVEECKQDNKSEWDTIDNKKYKVNLNRLMF